MDGASVLPLLDGTTDAERTVVGEYLGEGAVAPIFMIRRGPLEVRLVATGRRRSSSISTRTRTSSSTWSAIRTTRTRSPTSPPRCSVAGIRTQSTPPCVPASVLGRSSTRALRQGRFAAWDYQPTTDATNQYMRNHLDLNDVEAGRRA